MSDISVLNVKFCKSIYNYITPIIIIYEENKTYIKSHRTYDTFAILIDIRNTVCHCILNENCLRKLFVNMVLFYKIFELNLLEKFKKILYLWNEIKKNDKIFKLSTDGAIPNNGIPLGEYGGLFKFYKDFKQLLKYLHGSGRASDVLKGFKKTNKTDIKLILKYGSPIILWYQNVEEHFLSENKSDLLFQISRYTRHLSCHMLSIMKEENLKPLIANICIIYLAFGVDLYDNRKKVEGLLKIRPSICTFVNEEIEIQVGVETQSVGKDVVINYIKNILINKFNPWNKEYFLFGKYLHHFVSMKITNCANITKVFTNFKNRIDWRKGMNKNEFDRDIFKLVSPLFVWIRVVDSLKANEFNKDQEFYLSIIEKRNKIIEYLVKYKYGYQEILILFELTNLHLPIKDFFTGVDMKKCKDNLKKNQYYNLFKELVEHAEFRENNKFSCSFIFKYNQTRNPNHAKLCDIFNFSGIFIIFINYFERLPVIFTDFYFKVEKVSDQIIKYMLDKIQKKPKKVQLLNLKNAIDGIESIFSDFRKTNTSNYNIFHIIFSQLYYHIISCYVN